MGTHTYHKTLNEPHSGHIKDIKTVQVFRLTLSITKKEQSDETLSRVPCVGTYTEHVKELDVYVDRQIRYSIPVHLYPPLRFSPHDLCDPICAEMDT